MLSACLIHVCFWQAQEKYAEHVFSKICGQYDVLAAAIEGGKGLSASNEAVQLSQPWTQQ